MHCLAFPIENERNSREEKRREEKSDLPRQLWTSQPSRGKLTSLATWQLIYRPVPWLFAALDKVSSTVQQVRANQTTMESVVNSKLEMLLHQTTEKQAAIEAKLDEQLKLIKADMQMHHHKVDKIFHMLEDLTKY
jgi:hypothetical protein|eukprot:COSAG06_NODE_1820_length_8291_cov_14.479858_2_plen_135_part_00